MDAANLVKAAGTVVELTTAALALMDKAKAIGLVIQKAQSEGRDLNDQEMQTLRDADDLARAKLELSIQSADRQ